MTTVLHLPEVMGTCEVAWDELLSLRLELGYGPHMLSPMSEMQQPWVVVCGRGYKRGDSGSLCKSRGKETLKLRGPGSPWPVSVGSCLSWLLSCRPVTSVPPP